MATSRAARLTESIDVGADLEALHAAALRRILIVVPIVAIYVHYALSINDNPVNPIPFAFGGGIVGVSGLAYLALRYGSRPAAATFILGQAVLLQAALVIFRLDLLAFWFAPLVVVGVALLGERPGAALAAGATAILLVDKFALLALSAQAITSAALLAWVSLLLGWLLAHPTRRALNWAWHSYAQALGTAEELRDHQEQLERAMKSLNLAYVRLEELNVELARARRAAEQSRRLKAEFAAAISHELRTPLNLIIGFSEMMVTAPQTYRGLPLPETYRGDLEAIYRNACHLSSLVDDVLDLSQIEADRMGLQRELMRLAPAVDEAVTTIARLFGAKGLSLSVEVPLDLPPVYADPTRVRQVLINLLNNAARFTGQGGVTVRASVQGSDVVVSVADTGVGIAPESLSMVFEEFRQVQVLGQRRVVGSGLGLAVSKRIVELHGGAIWVESTPGEGSTFFFSLPRCENVLSGSGYTRPETWSVAPPPNPTDRTILVIDRGGEAGHLFGRHLDGFRVLVAPTVEAARRAAASSVISAAAIVDRIGRPDQTTLRRFGEIFPRVPIVVCSLNRRKLNPRELGAVDCLVKPVGREQVRLALRRLHRPLRTVLIVDDDPEMVRLLGRLVRLEARRAEVWEALNGSDALSLLQTRRPDLVLLDLVMPGVNGEDVLQGLREQGELRDVPVILVTGHGTSDEMVTADFFGITQPGGLTVRELMRCLRTSLEAVHRPEATLLQHLDQRGPAHGLGQEGRCPHGQGEGALLDDRADDNRNGAGLRVLLEDLEQLPPVAQWQHQVQNDQPRR